MNDERGEFSPFRRQIPSVYGSYAVVEWSRVVPAEFVQSTDVEQFAWRSVGFRGVVLYRSVETDYRFYGTCQLVDGTIFARADIDMYLVGIVHHKEYQSICQVVDVEKLSHRFACTPEYYLLCLRLFRFVEFPYQSG